MRRRGDDVPPAELVLDGKRYASVQQWQRAKDARDDRRARIMARISVERGELLAAPGVSVGTHNTPPHGTLESARTYLEQLANEQDIHT